MSRPKAQLPSRWALARAKSRKQAVLLLTPVYLLLPSMGQDTKFLPVGKFPAAVAADSVTM